MVGEDWRTLRADLPSRRRPDLETATVETIVIETTVCDRKWAILCCYRSPSISDNVFTNDFTVCMDNLHVHFDNIIVITVPTKSKALKSVCDVFDLSSLVKLATCFTKTAPPSLIDVILTNRPTLLAIYTTKLDGVVCPPNISETVAVRTVKLAHRQCIASTTIKFISKPILLSIL